MSNKPDPDGVASLRRQGLTLAGATKVVELDVGWIATGRELRLSHRLAATHFFRHGWQSWSIGAWQNLDQPPVSIAVHDLQRQADDPALAGRADHVGSWVGVVEDEDGVGLLLGALGTDATVSVGDAGLLGQSETEIDWLVAIGEPDACLKVYATSLASVLGSRRSHPGPVWCTWYSQGRNLDAVSIGNLISEVSELPFEVFLVDDGWERAIGDWHPNSGFRDGMGKVAAEIERHGMRPGIWLAPLAVESKEADDWEGCLVEDEEGRPLPAGRNWDTVYYGVDVSHPRALDRVVESVERAVDWGFTYLKLDFLFAGAIPGKRHLDAPREQIFRLAMEQIRAAVGEEVHLNACGAPILPSLGIFDSIRVGPDSAPYWESPLYEYVGDYSAPGTRRAIATSLSRLWLQEAILVDPDVVFFRSRLNLLDDEQRRLFQDLATITGFLATSDPPGWLDEQELSDLARFLRQTPDIARVDRTRFRIGDRIVDFSEAVEGAF